MTKTSRNTNRPRSLRTIQPAAKPLRAPTEFEQRLYAATKLIPLGCVTTYGALASLLGSSPRAVGQGMRRNPYAPVVPCHRVISSDLQLGGFYGAWGEDTAPVCKKREMLLLEGVKFVGSKVDPCCVLDVAGLKKLQPGSSSL